MGLAEILGSYLAALAEAEAAAAEETEGRAAALIPAKERAELLLSLSRELRGAVPEELRQ